MFLTKSNLVFNIVSYLQMKVTQETIEAWKDCLKKTVIDIPQIENQTVFNFSLNTLPFNKIYLSIFLYI